MVKYEPRDEEATVPEFIFILKGHFDPFVPLLALWTDDRYIYTMGIFI